MGEGLLRSKSIIAPSNHALSAAWRSTEYAAHIIHAIRSLLPNADAVLFAWRGDHLRQLSFLDTGVFREQVEQTPWVKRGAAISFRPFDPLVGEAVANQAITLAGVRRVYAETLPKLRELLLDPLEAADFMRVSFYRREQYVGTLNVFRHKGSAGFSTSERQKLTQNIPALAEGLYLRRIVDLAPLRAGEITLVVDAIQKPAFLMSPNALIIYANSPARATSSELVELAARKVIEEQQAAWFTATPLQLGSESFWLVIIDPLSFPPIMAEAAPWAQRLGLAPRLARIAAGIQQGWSDKEIAKHLGLSPNTVRTYVQRLYARVSVHGRGELLRLLEEASR